MAEYHDKVTVSCPSKIAANHLISHRNTHFASKLPYLQHLFHTPGLNATILPSILHPIYSLPDYFYAIIGVDRQVGGR